MHSRGRAPAGQHLEEGLLLALALGLTLCQLLLQHLRALPLGCCPPGIPLLRHHHMAVSGCITLAEAKSERQVAAIAVNRLQTLIMLPKLLQLAVRTVQCGPCSSLTR